MPRIIFTRFTDQKVITKGASETFEKESTKKKMKDENGHVTNDEVHDNNSQDAQPQAPSHKGRE